MSAVRSALGVVLLLLLAGAALSLAVYYRLEHPPRPEVPSQAVIAFDQGTSTAEIFRRLAKEGVVRNARLAEIYYRLYRGRTPLQAGEYRFDRPMPIDDIINHMGRGEVLKYSVVVPDGLTAEETFELFWKAGVGGPDAFHRAFRETELLRGLASGVSDLEGFLFPET